MGSPPHMQGKAKAYLEACFALRITPAHAGKSQLYRTARRPSGDHPRACGEKMGLNWRPPYTMGSPPRMRGKGTSRFRGRCPSRITPAHAGKRPALLAAPRGPRDHPRVCGEKSLMTCRRIFWTGSPPHMRGKAKPSSLGSLERRITPAHAGKRPRKCCRFGP